MSLTKTSLAAPLRNSFVVPPTSGNAPKPQATQARATDVFDTAAARQKPSKWFPPHPKPPKPPKASTSTVTVSSNGPTAIVTHGQASSTLHVDQDMSVTDLSATIDLHHKWVSGLTVTVTSPSGKTATIPLTKGNDEKGTFDLSRYFGGESAKGDWKLTVDDSLKTDSGQVNSWSLKIGGNTGGGGGGGGGTGTGPIDPKDIPAADWTCFVNLNADNSLESFGKADLNEMESVGSLAGKMNVIALVDGGSDSGNGWTTGTRLMYVTRDADTGKVSSREIAVDPNSDLGKLLAKGKGELDTGSPETLHAAIDYVQKNVKSQHFMVDLWDHGNDWRGVSYDDHPSDNLDMPGLQKALSGLSQKVDIVSADACLMATVEVADTAKAANVDWLVGSEEVEPGEGWNYNDFLTRVDKLFAGKSDVSSADVAHAIVDSYNAGGGENATMSATDTSKLAALNGQIDAFSDAFLAAGGFKDGKLKAAYEQTLRFDDADQMDLGDFAKRVAAATSDAKLKVAAGALLTSIGQTTTEKSAGSKYAGATGLTIYGPRGSVDSAYKATGVTWTGSHWNKVIAQYSLRAMA
jgi:subtilisin-like proprotein convertase family protein